VVFASDDKSLQLRTFYKDGSALSLMTPKNVCTFPIIGILALKLGNLIQMAGVVVEFLSKLALRGNKMSSSNSKLSLPVKVI
jgi:hypothetical protein